MCTIQAGPGDKEEPGERGKGEGKEKEVKVKKRKRS